MIKKTSYLLVVLILILGFYKYFEILKFKLEKEEIVLSFNLNDN